MQKWTALLFAVLLVAFVAAAVVARPSGPGQGAAGSAHAADAGADAARDGATDASAAGDAEAAEDPAGPNGDSASALDGGAGLLAAETSTGLGPDAPKSVVFGVILVQYKGAQGAPPNAMSRDAALEQAKQLAEEAKQDFKGTVAKLAAKGDKGSMENAGKMPRGMLERGPERALFSLPKDGVSDPVDTPTGFWILRRIE